ncbi:MAG: WD40 repeat domain-containing serine/threonine-protein kinase [Pirellulales bacterium]
MNEEAIFAEARPKPTPAERDEFLRHACGDDAALRARVEALLDADKAHDSLLDEPLVPQSETVELRATIEKPGDQVGDYKLLQEIGEGGFGVVFMAEQLRPIVRRVALKIIKPGMDSREVIARFEAERQALAMMDHPNIAKVLGAGATSRGRPYFVMELVRGIRITQFCDDQQLTPKERLELFIPVCHAIQHAHQKGVIHRDIKPSNILVSLYDGHPVPKVIDFGVAKAIQQRLTEKTMFTQFGQVIGTLEYMSPEQAEMNELDIDTRADVYSLGAVLYELLTGSPPFERKRLRSAAFDQVLRIIREEEPPRPSLRLSTSEKLASISAQRKMEPARLSRLMRGEIDWIVMKALDKQRSRRYDSASRLAADIEAHLGGLSVSAVAPSTAYRVQKYARRHKAALAVAATIAGLLLAGTAVSTVLAIKEMRAQDNEREQRILAQKREEEANQARQRLQVSTNNEITLRKQAERDQYYFHMLLAPSDWANANLSRLQQSLSTTSNYHDRGFEWYYWQAQLRQERRTIYPQVGQLWRVRLAADQRDLIVDTAFDRSYRLDAKTGNVLAAYGTGPMSTNGRWLAEGPHGEIGPTVTVIDTTTGMRTAVHLPQTQQNVAVSPDGAHLITIDYVARTSHLWDVRTSTQLREIKPCIYEAQFSPDGQWFAGNVIQENRSEIELRRASDGEQIPAPEAIGLSVLGFTPDSSYLARWDGATGQIRFHSTIDLSDKKHVPCEGAPWQIAFSPDGTYVAIKTRDKIVIKEVDTARSVSSYRVNQLSAIVFSHDGHELITCSSDGAVKFFPIQSLDYIQIGSRVWNLQFSDDGNRLLLMTDGGPRLIDVASRKVLAEYPKAADAGLFPNGRQIATAPPYVHSEEKSSTRITIADDKSKSVRDIKFEDRVYNLVIAPDGRHIFVAAPRASNSWLDAETGKTIFQRPDKEIHAVGFLPDGKQFALAFHGESQFRIYDAATARQADSIPYEPEVTLRPWIQFSQDGKLAVTSYENAAASIYGVSIYDMGTKERIRRITGHAGFVYAAYFSPDGRRLFTKSSDGTVRLWDVENDFELLLLPDGGNVDILPGRAFAPDGRMIAIAGPEGVFLKVAATPEQVAAWQSPPTQPPDTRWWKRLGGIQDWLVLAPIPREEEQLADDLDKQQLQNEADLDPSAGEVAQVGGEKLAWKEETTSDCVLDFQKVTSPNEDNCLAYAVTHIYSDAPREGVRLLFGSDDFAKVYLNGKPIHECRQRRAAVPADDEVLINLRKGKNVLVCKVIDDEREWGVSAQIVGDDYQAIPGVTTGIKTVAFKGALSLLRHRPAR